MKLLIVLFVSVALTSAVKLTEEQTAKVNEFTTKCASTEGTTKLQALGLLAGNFEDKDPKVKCVAKCILETTGVLVDGKLHADTMLTKLGAVSGVESLKTTLANCESVKGTDLCDTGYQLFQCIYKHRVQ